MVTCSSCQWLNGSCLSCSFCQQADEPLCSKALLSGYTVDGTFQQYAVAKGAHVAHLPPDIPLDKVAPILCAGITVYKGLKESGARPGETVAIVGAGGGLGCYACQFAKTMGLQVVAIDSGEEKRKMCLDQLGVESFVDFATSKDLVADVKKVSNGGEGPNAVLLVAVNEKPFQQIGFCVFPSNNTDLSARSRIRPISWHSRGTGYARPRFPQGTRLPDCGSHDYDQGQLRGKPP